MSDELTELDRRIIAIASEQCGFDNPAHGEIVGLAMVQLRDELGVHFAEFERVTREVFGHKHKATFTIEVNLTGDKAVVSSKLRFANGGNTEDERTDVAGFFLRDKDDETGQQRMEFDGNDAEEAPEPDPLADEQETQNDAP